MRRIGKKAKKNKAFLCGRNGMTPCEPTSLKCVFRVSCYIDQIKKLKTIQDVNGHSRHKRKGFDNRVSKQLLTAKKGKQTKVSAPIDIITRNTLLVVFP